MGEKTHKVLVCDVCKKEASDCGKFWVGGHPHASYVKLTKNYSSRTKSLPTETDFCSISCLLAFLIKDNKDEFDFQSFDSQMDIVKIAASIILTEYFGEKCPDFCAGCECCDRWAWLHQLTSNSFVNGE